MVILTADNFGTVNCANTDTFRRDNGAFGSSNFSFCVGVNGMHFFIYETEGGSVDDKGASCGAQFHDSCTCSYWGSASSHSHSLMSMAKLSLLGFDPASLSGPDWFQPSDTICQ